MSEEDITKSKNGVDPQEKEFDQQQTEIEELRAAISDLKNENHQLKEDLRNTARLAHNIYMQVDSGAEDTSHRSARQLKDAEAKRRHRSLAKSEIPKRWAIFPRLDEAERHLGILAF